MPYQKGQSGNLKGRPKGSSVPEHLAHMRWVAKNPDAPTDIPLRKQLQVLFKDSFDKFLTMLRKDESEFTGRKDAGKADEPGKTKDQGSDRIEELIEQILSRAEQDSA